MRRTPCTPALATSATESELLAWAQPTNGKQRTERAEHDAVVTERSTGDSGGTACDCGAPTFSENAAQFPREAEAEGSDSKLRTWDTARQPLAGMQPKADAELDMHFLLERVRRDKQLAVEFRDISAFVPNLFGPSAERSVWQHLRGRAGGAANQEAAAQVSKLKQVLAQATSSLALATTPQQAALVTDLTAQPPSLRSFCSGLLQLCPWQQQRHQQTAVITDFVELALFAEWAGLLTPPKCKLRCSRRRRSCLA